MCKERPMKRIHTLGVVVLDALSGPLGDYPERKGRTQSVTKSVRFLPGGGAANTAGSLAKMGLAAGIFSKLGDDFAGRFLLEEFARSGVETAGIRLSKADTTPFTFVGIHEDGDRTFVHTPGANLTFAPEDVDLDRLLAADFLLYCDLWCKPRLDGLPGAAILAEARRRGVVTLLDECFGLGPNREQMEAMLPHCDYFLPSLDDMRVIYPGASVDHVADALLACGVSTVVLKMGGEGCLVARGKERVRVPAFPTRVVDATGAGDSWDAGFLAGLAHGEDVLAAARIGNAAASFCIQAVGGASGIPEYAAVREKAAG
jgi:sugar/nucleoside kinase (ribokinase family)